MSIRIDSVEREILISNSVVGLIMFLSLWWVSVNVPEYFTQTVIYMFALIMYMLFCVTRVLPSYGFNTDNIIEQLIVGAGASILLALPVITYRLFDITVSIAILTVSPVTVFFIIVVAPIIEEMIFRGLMLPVISEFTGNVVLGVLFTAVIFAVFHYGVYGLSIINMLWLIILAIMLGFLTVYTESIVPAIILHMVNNTMSLLPYLVFINGYNIGVGLVFAIASAIASAIICLKDKRILLFIVIGIIGIATSTYVMLTLDNSLNMYSELLSFIVIAVTMPLAMLLSAYVSDRLGLNITDKVLYALTILVAILVCLVSYYTGVSIYVVILGVIAGASIAYLVESTKS